MPIRFATPDQHTLAESVQPKTSENASETTNCSLDRAPNPFLIESYDCDQLDLSAIKLNTVRDQIQTKMLSVEMAKFH